jgi:predicted RNase H-like nuclease (RuvC/YqgF family)
LGKTETIKKRAIWIYAPTLEQREQWNEIAKNNGMPLSRWIVHTIEDSILNLEDESKSRKDIEEENKNLRKEIYELQNRLRQVTIIRDNLEREISRYRAEPFINESFEGVRRFDKELISLLRNAKAVDGKNRFVDNDEILSRLGVKFSEVDSVKAISNQLSRLEGYDLVISGTKGWKWKIA